MAVAIGCTSLWRGYHAAMPGDRYEDDDLDADDHRPMTEAEWEEHFKESEVRSARFGDLFETLMDHPDRDAIIDREMGWADADLAPDDDENPEDDFPADAWEQEKANLLSEAEAALNDPQERAAIEDELRREREELERLPAYRLAFDTGLKVHQAVAPALKGHVDEQGESIDEMGEYLQEADANALLPAAKIAGGHGMGYDEDVLCGNIVCCRRARDAAVRAIEALRWLGAHQGLRPELAAQLAREMQQVVDVIDARIADLRANVWWS